MKAGICRACGKAAQVFVCDFCGAFVCVNCKSTQGCKICKGRKTRGQQSFPLR